MNLSLENSARELHPACSVHTLPSPGQQSVCVCGAVGTMQCVCGREEQLSPIVEVNTGDEAMASQQTAPEGVCLASNVAYSQQAPPPAPPPPYSNRVKSIHEYEYIAQ